MTGIVVGALLCLTPTTAPAQQDPLDRWDRLLTRYVVADRVDYANWRANRADYDELRELVAALAATDPATLSAPERYALYINLYNARIVEIVLTEDPPRSIRDVIWTWFGYGVFFKDDLVFDGKKTSLHKLEKRLRRESGDPRIHFAVNCASASCPPLVAWAYRGELLDTQLDRVTREFLARPENLRFEEARGGSGKTRLHVSKIFKWYDGDFESAGGVHEFIRLHAPAETARRLEAERARIKLAYQEYDWSLNSSPPPQGR
jgi:hypothetical protein